MHFCYALFAAVLLVGRISADSGFCDPSAWQEKIGESCLNENKNATAQLIMEASACAFDQEVRVYTPYAYLNETLQPMPSYAADLNYSISSIKVIIGVSDDTLNATEELNRDISSYYDAFVVEAEFLPDFAQVGVVAPLERAIITEPHLDWYRINRYYRAFSATDQAKAYGVPLGGAGAFLFYRQDLLRHANVSVPATWEELLATARAWNATNSVPGVTPFCISGRSQCQRTLLLSIAAPYLQAGGTREGFLIDPANGELLFNSSGFVAALRMWQQLVNLSAVDDTASCSGGPDSFSEGRCLMTVQCFPKFKVYAANTSSVADVMGVALTPGSAVVLNRTTGNLEDCTATSCPYAVRVETGGADKASTGGSGRLVNSAPFMWGGLVGMISARNPWALQHVVLHYLAGLTSSRSLENVLRKDSRISPFRADHWSPASRRNWTDAGYAGAAVTQMTSALQQLHASPNLAPQLRLPGQEGVSHALNAAIADLMAGHVPEEVAAGLQAEVAGLLRELYGEVNGTAGYLAMYRQELGYVESAATAPTSPGGHHTSGVSRQTVVVIAVVIGLVALLASVVVLEVRNKRRHKDLLGRVKPPLGDPDTTIVVASIQDFDELWEALISDASERALQQFSDLVDALLRRHSGYRAPSDEEDVVAAFHNPRDACEFARELQRGLLELRWPKHVLEMEQFRPQYLAQTKRATSFSQSYNGARTAAMAPLAGSMPAAEDDDKLFTLDTGAENVRSFGEQCVASWSPASPPDGASPASSSSASPDAELVFCGIRARVGVCAVGYSQLALDVEPGHRRFSFVGEAVEVAAAAAAAAQGGMVLIPQSTFRQLHLEVLAEQCLFCHLGEYQLTSDLPPMDLYLALDRHLLGRLALFGPLACHMQWSQGAFAAPVHSASMVFTHVVGVQTLLAWDYDLMQDVIETFTKLAQVELQQAGGYLVEHVEGFMLTAFHSPADAILWGLRMQELMLKEDWPEELLAHELCEEVTVTVPVRGGEVTSATVFRGPRLKTGIDIGHVLARLHTMTGRMTYRGKVMNRAARISAAASSGQVLCSAEAWESCTASASALRLVTATSLGLFQLKGIQERIEVFHCTYQRHAPSSTRRSSTVSVGVVSSSDNRRKSAVVLSSNSHVSHHTTSYRTSHHNSVALDHVSASDATGGRRGSQTSSAALLPGRSSLAGGQLSDMLHMVGADAIASGSGGAAGGGGGGPAAVAAAAAAARYRAGPVPYGGEACASQTGSSHRSHGSGASGGGAGAAPGGVLASRAALAAVLQSRTRSASAIQANGNVTPFRSASARSRRPVGLSGGVVGSDPQVSIAVGAAAHAAKWNAATATSPSATPSLAMAAAAAAAAAHERANGGGAFVNGAAVGAVGSPKAAAALDVPRRGASSNCDAIDSTASTHSTIIGGLTGVSGGVNADAQPASFTAAVFAVLPSVVLSAGVHPSTSSGGVGGRATVAAAVGAQVGAAHDAHEARGGADGGAAAVALGSRWLAAAPPSIDSGGCGGGGASSCMLESCSPNDLQMATIATCVDDMVPDCRDGGASDGGAGCGGVDAAPAALHQHHVQRLRQYRQQQQPSPASSPPFRFERMVPLDTLQEDSSTAAAVAASVLCGDGGDIAEMLHADGGGDGGSRVETLEVTVSATGIVRGALSGAASSNGFGAGLCSSHSASVSRCGSANAGISYLALGLSGGLGSSPGGTAGGGAAACATGTAGSHASSCASSGFGHVSAAVVAPPPPRPQSAAVWRPSMSISASPQLHGLPAASTSSVAVVRRSGSVNSADLFLPLPLAACGAAGGGTANSTSSGMAALIGGGANCPPAGGQLASGDMASDGGGGVSAAAPLTELTASAPLAVPRRLLGPMHHGRLAVVAEAATPDGGGAASRAGAGSSVGRRHDPLAGAPALNAAPAIGTSPDDDGAAAAAAAAAVRHGAGRVIRLGSIACDASGSADASDILVSASRSNSGNTAAAAGGAASLPSGGGGRLGFANSGANGGSGSGRLRASTRTGSGVSNDCLPSQAVSPSSTWASGGSAGSTTATSVVAPGTASLSPAVGSGVVVGLDPHQLLTQQRQEQLRHQHKHHHSSLRALLDGGGVGAAAAAAAAPPDAALVRGSLHHCGKEDRDLQDDDGAAAGLRQPGSFGGHRLRAVGHADGGSGGGGNTAAERAASAAMAAAFGIAPPPPPPLLLPPPAPRDSGAAAVAAAAAAFGVGPPQADYSCDEEDSDRRRVGGAVGGPTREQLARALELLGESSHAAGAGDAGWEGRWL